MTSRWDFSRIFVAWPTVEMQFPRPLCFYNTFTVSGRLLFTSTLFFPCEGNALDFTCKGESKFV